MRLPTFNQKKVKQIGLIALVIIGLIVFFSATGWVANALPETQLTSLPYTWYMMIFRASVYAGLFYYYHKTRYALVILTLIIISYEYVLNGFYHAAMEGLLWQLTII
ncbi:hypothetical protein [Photobacterium leiognathi]|uniref:hypothetical protein n=1 Tax=Photobacterium leiognathi TaxID=553611 RepID=UPI0029820376|nr:hypothetical protein [Photobacterium leiognathi]